MAVSLAIDQHADRAVDLKTDTQGSVAERQVIVSRM
jgi:hypothetical protein